MTTTEAVGALPQDLEGDGQVAGAGSRSAGRHDAAAVSCEYRARPHAQRQIQPASDAYFDGSRGAMIPKTGNPAVGAARDA
jgi:hypothetical protein